MQGKRNYFRNRRMFSTYFRNRKGRFSSLGSGFSKLYSHLRYMFRSFGPNFSKYR